MNVLVGNVPRPVVGWQLVYPDYAVTLSWMFHKHSPFINPS